MSDTPCESCLREMNLEAWRGSLVDSPMTPERAKALLDRFCRDDDGYIEILPQAPALATLVLKQEEELARLRKVLEWYADEVAGCRKLTSEGDRARRNPDADGGQRARAALSPTLTFEPAELAEELERLRGALAWYANDGNYDEDGAPGRRVDSPGGPWGPPDIGFELDLGVRANEALFPTPPFEPSGREPQ